MSKRESLQAFITEVVPTFRDRNAWQDLAWNVINKLEEDQLDELLEDFRDGLMIVATDDWSDDVP